MAKIQIRKWHVLDLYFNEVNEKEVEELVKEYVKKGWRIEDLDYASVRGYDSSYQLMKWDIIKNKKIKPQ